jgi:hypothetical protein
MEDGRKAEIILIRWTKIQPALQIIFDPETQNPVEMQREGWYAILNNFHKYVENN